MPPLIGFKQQIWHWHVVYQTMSSQLQNLLLVANSRVCEPANLQRIPLSHSRTSKGICFSFPRPRSLTVPTATNEREAMLHLHPCRSSRNNLHVQACVLGDQASQGKKELPLKILKQAVLCKRVCLQNPFYFAAALRFVRR